MANIYLLCTLSQVKELQKATRTIQTLCSEAKVCSVTPILVIKNHLLLYVVYSGIPLTYNKLLYERAQNKRLSRVKFPRQRGLWNGFYFMSRLYFTQLQVDVLSGQVSVDKLCSNTLWGPDYAFHRTIGLYIVIETHLYWSSIYII